MIRNLEGQRVLLIVSDSELRQLRQCVQYSIDLTYNPSIDSVPKLVLNLELRAGLYALLDRLTFTPDTK